MIWIAPSEKDAKNSALEKRFWDAADQFRANSGLKSEEYSAPVLGLIFLRFAEVRFSTRRTKLEKSAASSRRGSRLDDPAAYQADGMFYLTPNACFEHLLALAGPMVQLYSTIQNLRWTRDLLLPRLLSGQINLAEN